MSSSPPCTTGGTVINEDLVDAQLHAAPAMEMVVRVREESRVRHRAPNTHAVRPSGLERRTQLSRVEEIPVLTQHPTDSRELARAGAQVRLTLTRPRAKPAML